MSAEMIMTLEDVFSCDELATDLITTMGDVSELPVLRGRKHTMSAEMVTSLEDVVTTMGSVAALPVLLAKGFLTGSTALGSAAAHVMEEAAEKRRKSQAAEVAALGREIDKLARSRASKAPPVLNRKFVDENRKNIQNMLDNLKLDTARLDIGQFTPAGNASAPEQSKLVSECKELYAALALLDDKYVLTCGKFIDELDAAPLFRKRIIYDNLRIEYGNALHKHAIHVWQIKKLQNMLTSLDGEEAHSFQKSLLNVGYPDSYIDENNFKSLINFYKKLIKKDIRRKQIDIFEEQMLIKMKNLGYMPVGVSKSGSPYLFYTSEPDYRVMARVNPENGQLSLRFVRVVASEQEKKSITTAQKRRDMEQEQKWCQNAHRLLEDLSSEFGFEFKELYRRTSDEDHGVLVMVDSSLAETETRRKENARS